MSLTLTTNRHGTEGRSPSFICSGKVPSFLPFLPPSEHGYPVYNEIKKPRPFPSGNASILT
jgi:hypothetical protein